MPNAPNGEVVPGFVVVALPNIDDPPPKMDGVVVGAELGAG